MPVLENEAVRGAARLHTILEEATRIFSELSLLCSEQREALVACDTPRIVSLTERAETLAARFRLLESARQSIESAASGRSPEDEILVKAQLRELAGVVASAAVAASGNAALLARSTSATAAIRKVLDGAVSAGYLPTGEMRAPARSSLLEERA